MNRTLSMVAVSPSIATMYDMSNALFMQLGDVRWGETAGTGIISSSWRFSSQAYDNQLSSHSAV